MCCTLRSSACRAKIRVSIAYEKLPWTYLRETQCPYQLLVQEVACCLFFVVCNEEVRSCVAHLLQAAKHRHCNNTYGPLQSVKAARTVLQARKFVCKRECVSKHMSHRVTEAAWESEAVELATGIQLEAASLEKGHLQHRCGPGMYGDRFIWPKLVKNTFQGHAGRCMMKAIKPSAQLRHCSTYNTACVASSHWLLLTKSYKQAATMQGPQREQLCHAMRAFISVPP